MSGKKRTLIDQARDLDGKCYRTSSSSISSSSNSNSSGLLSEGDSQRETSTEEIPTHIPEEVIEAYLKANDYELVRNGSNSGCAMIFNRLVKSNVPPLDESKPELCIHSDELAIRPRCWEILKKTPRYAGLVASCSPPEFYVFSGHNKVSLIPHLKCLVALVYHLQSLNMDRANIHLEVCFFFTFNIRYYH